MRTSKSSASGNAIFIILIFIVLFAGLSFAVNQAMKGNSADSVTSQKNEINLTDLLSFANATKTATAALIANGCSETQLSFYVPSLGSGYINPSAPSDNSCSIFSSAGGGVTYIKPNAALKDPAFSYIAWNIAGSRRVVGLGTTASELNLYIIGMNKSLCMAINKNFGIAQSGYDVPANSFSTETFGTSAYATGDSIGNMASATSLQGKPVGCFQSSTGTTSGTYIFYYTLLVR